MTTIHTPDEPQPQLAQVFVQVQPHVPAQPGVSGFSVTALVTGILSLCLALLPGAGLILGIIAVVFGSLGWHQAKSKGRRGFGMAVAGLICGAIAVIVFAIMIIAIAASSGGTS